MPIVCASTIPASSAGVCVVGFVAQIEADDRGIILIACSERSPVIDPSRLGIYPVNQRPLDSAESPASER